MRANFRLALLAGAVCLVPLSSFVAETVRERASIHFSFVSWSTDPSSVPAVAPATVEAAGGTETFPALTPLGDSGLPALYPEIDPLGQLDYSGIDGGLVAVLSEIAASLRLRALPAALCSPERPYLSVMTNYRLERFSDPARVFFSRPEAADDGLEASGSEAADTDTNDTDAKFPEGAEATIPENPDMISVFSLACPGEGGVRTVLLEITLAKTNEVWRVEDVTIEGGTHAAATRQD